MASVKNKQRASAGRKANKRTRLLPLHEAAVKDRADARAKRAEAWALKKKQKAEAAKETTANG